MVLPVSLFKSFVYHHMQKAAVSECINSNKITTLVILVSIKSLPVHVYIL